MAKINFTKAHFERLQTLASTMLFANETVKTQMGQVLNISELLHTTTVGTLTNIKQVLGKKIEKLEEADEWTTDNTSQANLELAKMKKELVNLLIGYKRAILEREATEAKKEKLQAELKKLKDSQKTPEDRIKEMEAELQSLDTEDFN